MNSSRLTLACIVFFIFDVFAQEPLQFPVVGKTENEDSQLRENIHLHLNKTTFLPGEHLWFTAYIQDQHLKAPSLTTTDLHVAIFNTKGQKLKHQKIFVENGVSSGDIAIDSTFVEGEYVVLSWTNYMRNFKFLRPFRQTIQIVQNVNEKLTPSFDKIQLEVFPEGGNLISGCYNRVGIRLTDTFGNGISSKNLEIVNEDGLRIKNNIATNHIGYGSFGISPQPNERYWLQFRHLNGAIAKAELPPAEYLAASLSVEDAGTSEVILKMVASNEFLKKNMGQDYLFAIYQNDEIFWETMNLTNEVPVLAINKNLLPFGVNTAVLFSPEMIPLARRMFFNHREGKKRQITMVLEQCITSSGDSLQIDLRVPKEKGASVLTSISVLPIDTKAYDPDHTIFSSLMLRPFIASDRQFDAYFLESQNRQRRFELDIRLLIEGWGRYKWGEKEREAAAFTFASENGIVVNGKLIDADLSKEKQVLLIPDEPSDMAYAVLESDKSFSAEMRLFVGDSLNISLLGKNGSLRKPKFELETGPVVQKRFEDLVAHVHDTSAVKRSPPPLLDMDEMSLGKDKRTIFLEEVTVMEKKKRVNKFLLSPSIQANVIGDLEIKRYKTVRNYLRRIGLLVEIRNGLMVVSSLKFPNPRLSIIVNGMPAQEGEVLNMPLSSVQTIVYSDKLYGGGRGIGGFVSIVLRQGTYLLPEYRDKFVKFLIENGYTRPQEYFTPNYPDNRSLFFRNYGAIDWKGNIRVGSEFPTSITIPLPYQNQLNLYIEGMGDDGTLVSQKEEIGINPK